MSSRLFPLARSASVVGRCLMSLALGSGLTLASALATPSTATAGRVASHDTHVARQRPGDNGSKGDDHYCDGCTPPLLYAGGPVMDTTGPTGVTITPIYWEPEGYATPFPDGYEQIINTYIADVAAASGADDNVYSINTEYYQVADDGTQTAIAYRITAGEPIIDTEPFPADGCEPEADYTGCITDDQIRTELTRLAAERGLTTDLANFYPMFFPPGIETADLDGSNSASSFCGYHRAFGEGSSEIVYGNEPYESSGCDGGQAPNGDVVADGAIGTLSHEINETLTDPTDAAAWNDSTGHEIGDICANDYGVALGSTDPDNATTTLYNQEINGGHYYTQTEFSNAAFASLGIGKGCVQSAAAVGAASPDVSTAVAQVFTYAQPNAVDADGTSTLDISTSVSDHDNNVIEGDRVAFSVYAIKGDGQCGQLSSDSELTGADGYAKVTYTASSDDVICAVVATDAQGGQSSVGSVYQGAEQANAPVAEDTFPTTMEAGAEATTFTTSFTNPTDKAIVNAQIDFSIFPADAATTDVTADQVQLSYSTEGIDGPYTPVTLEGSTVEEGGIEGVVGDAGGATIGAGETLTITYQFAIDGSVVPDGNEPLFSFEAYLDQINLASGAGTNLADTGFTDVVVSPSGAAPVDTSLDDTASDDTPSNDAASADTAVADDSSDSSSSNGPLIIVAIVVVVVVGAGVFVVLRKRR